MPGDAPSLLQRPSRAVIPAAELALWGEAAALLQQMQADAEASRAAQVEALDGARAAGRAEGLADGAAAIATRLAELEGHKAATVAAVEAALPSLVSDVLEHLVGEPVGAELLARSVRHGLGLQRWEGRAVLRVSPDDQEAARQAVQSDGRGATIGIEVDAGMPPGHCLFECDHGSIELGLQAQLGALRDGIEKGWHEAAP